jgi:hypothetical protein
MYVRPSRASVGDDAVLLPAARVKHHSADTIAGNERTDFVRLAAFGVPIRLFYS